MGVTGLSENQLFHRSLLMVSDRSLCNDPFSAMIKYHKSLPNQKVNSPHSENESNVTLLMRIEQAAKDFLFRYEIGKYCNYINYSTLYIYTAIQLMCFVVIYGITWTVAGVGFPILVMLLIPIRIHVLPYFFSVSQLESLDGFSATPTWPQSIETTLQ